MNECRFVLLYDSLEGEVMIQYEAIMNDALMISWINFTH